MKAIGSDLHKGKVHQATNQAGKGMKPRTGYNSKAYYANVDAIKGFSWSKPRTKH